MNKGRRKGARAREENKGGVMTMGPGLMMRDHFAVQQRANDQASGTRA